MIQIKNEKEIGFTAAYNKFYKLVLNYIIKRMRDSHLAEDLTQQAFLRFFKSKFNSWNDEEHTRKFIIKVAGNCIKNHIKRMQNPTRNFISVFESDYCVAEGSKKNINRELHDSDYFKNLTILSCDIVEQLAGAQQENEVDKVIVEIGLMKKITDIIDTMPPKQKKAMLMVHFDGMKPREVAAQLKTTAGCVSFLICKGKQKIKEKLKHVQNLL
jgi:RNA polymerase sigma factor (sigma-70 family)